MLSWVRRVLRRRRPEPEIDWHEVRLRLAERSIVFPESDVDAAYPVFIDGFTGQFYMSDGSVRWPDVDADQLKGNWRERVASGGVIKFEEIDA